VHNSRKSLIPIAEAMVLGWGLQEAVKVGYKFIEIEGDSKTIIDAVMG